MRWAFCVCVFCKENLYSCRCNFRFSVWLRGSGQASYLQELPSAVRGCLPDVSVLCCAKKPFPGKGWKRPSGLLRYWGGHGMQDGAKSMVKTWRISGRLLLLTVGMRSPSRACLPQALWVKSWGRWCGAVGLYCTCVQVMLKWGCEEPLHLALFFSFFWSCCKSCCPVKK